MNSHAKKVLIITYYWPPSGGAGVQRWLKFCKYLPEFNIIPIVLTVDDKKATYPVLDVSLTKEINPELVVVKTNSFEPLSYYQRISGRAQVPFAGFANDSSNNWKHQISRFIRGNFFIPDARRGWNKYAIKAAEQLIKEHNIDTVITTSPPHSTQLIGLYLKRKLNIHWIADLRDPWTDIYYYSMMNHTSIAKKIDSKYEVNVLEQADQVVVVSQFIKKMFAAKSPLIDANKIAVIPNGFDEEDFASTVQAAVKSKSFVLSYIGTFAADYPIHELIEVFESILEKEPQFEVHFTGSIVPEIKLLLQSKLGKQVQFRGHVSHSESISYMQNADALLLVIADVPNNEGILTGKLFEYLATQKPIICIGPKHGNAAAIIDECKAGKTFDKSEKQLIREYLYERIEIKKKPSSSENKTPLFSKYSRRNLSQLMSKLIQK